MPPFVAEIAVVPLAMTDKIVFGEKNMQQNKASRSLETALPPSDNRPKLRVSAPTQITDLSLSHLLLYLNPADSSMT
ncbi:unnamed protein product [Rhodiola kirilowii]